MTVTTANYRPLLVGPHSPGVFGSPRYRRFLLDAAVVPGCRLIALRRGLHPEWPYIDTKFNPNTGEDLYERQRHVVFGWFLGRGAEALDVHRRWTSRLPVPEAERDALAGVLDELTRNHVRALADVLDRNKGRIPFRLDASLNGIDAAGRRVEMNPEEVTPGDVFAAKGILAGRSEAALALGRRLLLSCADRIRNGRDILDQAAEPSNLRSQGMHMLAMGAIARFCDCCAQADWRREALAVAAEFLRYILDTHFDAEEDMFAEYVDRQTGAKAPCLDPGHAAEMAGFGLTIADWLNREEMEPETVARARRDMPRILLRSFRLGYNARHRGLHKTVHPRTGAPIDGTMPWWNLPETMRAAVRALAVTSGRKMRSDLMDTIRLAHNAYFGYYLNPNLMLFPYQVRDGSTGKVLDRAPAVPEGDPLYHANLAFLDVLEHAAPAPVRATGVIG